MKFVFSKLTLVSVGLLCLLFNCKTQLFAQKNPSTPADTGAVTQANTGATRSNLLIQPVIPPSPDAASLGKFGEIPVSEYTGVPNISVPLYTITARDITVPIGLHYHAGGVKVQEDASWVGLGWALRAGGSISRTIRGQDDLVLPNGFIYQSEINELTDQAQINGIGNGSIDSQPDLFNLDVAGLSLRFVLPKGQMTSSGGFTKDNQLIATILNPSDNTQIRLKKTTSGNDFIWEVTTPDGTLYKFGTGGRERTKSYGGSDYFLTNPTTPDQVGPSNGMYTVWNLTEIISPLKEQITFGYKGGYSSRGLFSITEEFHQRSNQLSDGCKSIFDQIFTNKGLFSFSRTYTYHAYLSTINFANGSVSFDFPDAYDEREDIEAEDLGGARKLNGITVKNSSGTAVRKWVFTYGYFQSSLSGTDVSMPHLGKRLRLDRIEEVDATSGVAKLAPYRFLYKGHQNGQYNIDLLPRKNSQAYDEYGYYNGATQNNSQTTLIPYIPPTTLFGENFSYPSGSVDRSVKLEHAQKGTLETIIYPTGGSSTFAYQTHQAIVPANNTTRRLDFQTGTQTFTLSANSSVNIQAYLSGYPREPDPNNPNTGLFICSSINNRIAADTETWLSIKNASGAEVYALQYKDVYAMIGQASCDFLFNQTRTLSQGVYTVTISPRVITTTNPQTLHTAGATLYCSGTSSAMDMAEVGGLRIGTITHTDGVNTYAKNYTYSGGKIMSPIKHIYPRLVGLTYAQPGSGSSSCTNALMVTYTSWNIIPSGNSAQGSYVGYDAVTVADLTLENGQWKEKDGKHQYNFINRSDSVATASNFIPNFPLYPNVGNGRLQQESITNSTGNIVKYTLYQNSRIQQSIVKGFVPVLTGFSNQPYIGGQYALAPYLVYSDYWKTDKVITQESNLSGDAFVTTTTQNSYNPNYRTLEKVTTDNSKGQIQETIYKYPYSDPGNLGGMVNQNQVNTVIEETTNINGSFAKRMRKEYGLLTSSNNLFLPIRLRTQRQGEQQETIESTFTYDGLGNLATDVKRDGTKEQYAWYTDAARKNFLQSQTVSGANGDLARTTTYDYYPLVGLQSVVDPNNQTTYYEYDTFKRLSAIKDNSQNIVKTFHYNYGLTGSANTATLLSPNFKRILIIGNSITKLASQAAPDGWNSPALQASGGWGRAASVPEKDFVHLLESRFKGLNPSAQVVSTYQADFERGCSGHYFEPGWTSTTNYTTCWSYDNWQNFISLSFPGQGPDLVIIRLGENVTDSNVIPYNFKEAYRTLIDRTLARCSPGAKVILTNSFWSRPNANEAIRQLAVEKNLPLVDLSDMEQNPVYIAGSDPATLAIFPQLTNADNHPGDAGMLEIADRIWGKLFNQAGRSTTGSNITRVRLFPRTDDCCIDRIAGSLIQGSNDTTNVNGWTTLASIDAMPTAGWNEYPVYSNTYWRYVRFVAGPYCNGELKELEFYNGSQKLSGTTFGSPTTYTNNPASFGYQLVFDGQTTNFWHGTSAGSQNYAGLDLGASIGCSAFTASILSPTSNTTVEGNAVAGSSGFTMPFTINVCPPVGKSVGEVAIIASTPTGSVIRKVGNAVPVSGSPGTYSIASTTVAQGVNGGWLPPVDGNYYINPNAQTGPIEAGTFKYWVQAKTSDGSTTVNSATITVTMAPPAPAGPVTKASILPTYACSACIQRTIGGTFQGSNNMTDWTQLGSINSTLSSQTSGFFDVPLDAQNKTYRYLRYVAASGCYGELFELQFWSGNKRIVGTPFGSASYANNDASLAFTSAFDNNPATLWHGANVGPQNYAGLDLGGACTSLMAGILSPAKNTTIDGVVSTTNCARVTCALSVSTCVPAGTTISKVEVWASTVTGEYPNRMGYAIADASRPGVYVLSATEGSANGQWRAYSLDPNTYRFYAKIISSAGEITTDYNTITLNRPAGAGNCAPLSATILSPANGATIVGNPVAGSPNLTMPFTISVSVPQGQSISEVAIIAGTPTGSVIRKVGNAVAVSGSPGTYSLAGTTVAQGVNGGWLPGTGDNYYINPNAQTGPLAPNTPFNYWAQVKSADGSTTVNSATITVTMSSTATGTCSSATASMLSPANNASVVGVPSASEPGQYTFDLKVNTCVPAGVTISQVEVWATTLTGEYPNRMGYAVADANQTGVYVLSATRGQANGQWSNYALALGGYYFYAKVTTNTGVVETSQIKVTITSSSSDILCAPGNPYVLSTSLGQNQVKTITAQNSIQTSSTVLVPSNSTLFLKAPVRIRLMPGFKAQTGSTFNAKAIAISCN